MTYGFYRRRHAGERSYTWVKNTLQRAGHERSAVGDDGDRPVFQPNSGEAHRFTDR